MASLLSSICSLPTNPFFTIIQYPKKSHIISFLSPTQTTLVAAVQCHNNPNFKLHHHHHRRPRLPHPSAVSSAATTHETTTTQGDIGNRWREMIGINDWEGLLNPLDPLLRRELIKYGEFSQCTHEAFISDTYSNNYGICKFQTWDFFDHTLMPKLGYDATKFIYSTSHDTWWPPFIAKPANPRTWTQNNIWIGFVAVSDDATSKKLGRRDVCISWRGSETGIEWADDVRDYLTNIPPYDDFSPVPDPNVKVESGFLNLYSHKDKKNYSSSSSARELTLTEVKRLITQVYPNEDVSITVTGHSLGASLALLCAYDIVQTRTNVRPGGGGGAVVPTCAITFAGTRVGNVNFKESAGELGLKVLRIVNPEDVVTRVPGVFINEEVMPEWVLKTMGGLGFPWSYTHVGSVLELKGGMSPALKKPLDNAHNLDTYLHLVDGYHGKGLKFESATGRDLALVNRNSSNLLPHDDDYQVPPKWRVDQNKGMVQDQHGNWVHHTTTTTAAAL